MEQPRHIVIVGGGFAGVRAGLDLAAAKLPGTRITLISDKPHFEYHAELYRTVAGRSPIEVCIPLTEIFGTDDKDIAIELDRVATIAIANKKVIGESGTHYAYDYLILALGSQTTYFNIPGLRELSYSLKSVDDALRLKDHLHQAFSECEKLSPAARVCAAHIVVVGAGPSGVELAAELAGYTKKLATRHQLDQSLVKIDLVEGGSRILPMLPEAFTALLHRRLERLGVNILLNRPLVKEEVETMYLPDMQMHTKTVIWTAGVMPNELYASVHELPKDKKGRVIVGEHLEVEGLPGVYVLGDGAATKFSGLAQTALVDGAFAAADIARKILGKKLSPYQPKRPTYCITIGSGWSGVLMGNHAFYGRIGWFVRRAADFRFFSSILPFRKALAVFRDGSKLVESCPICTRAGA